MTAPGADTSQSLKDWKTVGSLVQRAGVGAVAVLLASGVPEADLVAYSVTSAPDGRVHATEASLLALALQSLAEPYPQMTLRAGIGWALLMEHREATGHDNYANGVAAPWVAQGLGEFGWLFLAAGLTLPEAQRVVASGDEDVWAGVWLMAGLSGVPLPSGTMLPGLVARCAPGSFDEDVSGRGPILNP